MKHFLTLKEFSRDEIIEILNLAIEIKRDFKNGSAKKSLEGKILAMIFEKSSTRTRVSFEAGIYQLGGSGIFQIGRAHV